MSAVSIPFYCAFLGFFVSVFESPKGTFFLFKRVLRSDRSFWHVLRILVHVFAKFGFSRRRLECNPSKVIDEGIFHIPFILMMSKEEAERFLNYYSKSISQLKVIFLCASPELIRSRMINRGHKRIRTAEDLDRFCQNHARLMIEYLDVLNLSGVCMQVIDE